MAALETLPLCRGTLTVTTRAFSPLEPSVLAVTAAGITAAADGAYLAEIHAQSATPPSSGVVPFVAVYIASIAILAIVGAVLKVKHCNAAAVTALVTGAVASGAIGFVAIFSIGLPLLVVACLLALASAAVTARGNQPVAWLPPTLGALIALGVLVGGFTLSGVFWGR